MFSLTAGRQAAGCYQVACRNDNKYTNGIRNFLFHRVSPIRDELWDPMSIELFDKCLGYISRKYKVVRFEDLDFTDRYIFHNKKIATIMFDDGYKDNIDYALPILKRHNLKASFYVVTECIDKNIPTWTHMLEHLFQHTSIEKIEMNFDFLPLDLKIRKLQNREERLRYVRKLKPFLKTLPH